MLWIIIGALLLLWVILMIMRATLRGLVHLLLVVAVVIMIVRLMRGRRPV
jgi:hypothetical protein